MPASGRRCSLRQFQELAGTLNWSFNVFPLLKPGLSNLYAKMKGKNEPNALIFVNKAIKDDLTWLVQHLHASSGVFFMGTEKWGPLDLYRGNKEDEIAYVDASGAGLGLFFPWLKVGYHCDLPSGNLN
ncbi:uncharacterized protein FIBRA_07988 [Fibroporia radiculosa]|uniref:Uncharacterized protein n=1 Tax=Fibroporia radiculosa TaxID=599839 RepID=J4IC42_9APHY|nr:uncharacterized protein FIBRA_07988 [Fibroporia radiculosa]CCM05756.1 predicted protein [Fibroporia radiculosa]